MKESKWHISWALALLLTAVNPCFAAAPNDGIPESWRVQYFGLNGVDSPQAAAIADPDGDGAINYHEFLSGTNPIDPTSNDFKPRAMSTYAGSVPGLADGPLSAATFHSPGAIRRDRRGRIWVVEYSATGFQTSANGAHCVRIIDTNGVVTTIAGAAEYGYADGPGLQARFQAPSDVAFDSFNNAYIADFQNHRIRKIDTNGIVTTFAGSTAGYFDGTGTNAKFDLPLTLAVDGQDNIYVADLNNLRVRKITPNRVVTTYAGSGRGYLDGDRLTAKFDSPDGLAFGPDGSLYVADWINGALRKISTNGMVSTVMTGFKYLERLHFDPSGNLYMTHSDNGITNLRKFSPAMQQLWAITCPYGFRDGAIATAQCSPPTAPLLLPDGNLVTTDQLNSRLRLITMGSAPLVVIEPASTLFTNSVSVAISSRVTKGTIRYTVDGSVPTAKSPAYTESVRQIMDFTVRAAVFVNQYQVTPMVEASFTAKPTSNLE